MILKQRHNYDFLMIGVWSERNILQSEISFSVRKLQELLRF